jgi:hypothetical protein
MLEVNLSTQHHAYRHEGEVRLIAVRHSGNTLGVEKRPHPNGSDELRYVRLKLPVGTPGSPSESRLDWMHLERRRRNSRSSSATMGLNQKA